MSHVRTLTICLLLVYFVSAAGCHCFDHCSNTYSFEEITHPYDTRAAHSKFLQLNRYNSSYGQKSFSYEGVKVWNSLPEQEFLGSSSSEVLCTKLFQNPCRFIEDVSKPGFPADHILEKVKSREFDVAARDQFQNTVLHRAIENHDYQNSGHSQLIKILIQETNQHATNINGETPLHWAARYNRWMLIDMMVDREADINCQNKEGDTPLHIAVIQRNTKTVSRIYLYASCEKDERLKTNIRNKIGLTALQSAECIDYGIPKKIMRILKTDPEQHYKETVENERASSLLALTPGRVERNYDAVTNIGADDQITLPQILEQQPVHVITQPTNAIQESEDTRNMKKSKQPIEQTEAISPPDRSASNVQVVKLHNQRKSPVETSSGIPRYPMNSKPRGHCLIISNKKFSQARINSLDLDDRTGSDVDAQMLEDLFAWLKFDVDIYEDKTAYEMYKLLKEFSEYDHSNFDCFVCCILTHGCSKGLYGTDGKTLNIINITQLYCGSDCPTLQNKPKLFFLQCCRGDLQDEGYCSDGLQQKCSPDPQPFEFSFFLNTMSPRSTDPNEGDFFIGYPTPQGYLSWRKKNGASWYMETLCEVFRKYASSEDLLSIMTEINNEVSKRVTFDHKRQMPKPTFTLRKKLFFYPDQL